MICRMKSSQRFKRDAMVRDISLPLPKHERSPRGIPQLTGNKGVRVFVPGARSHVSRKKRQSFWVPRVDRETEELTADTLWLTAEKTKQNSHSTTGTALFP